MTMTTQSSWKQSRSNTQIYINMVHQLSAQHTEIANASRRILCLAVVHLLAMLMRPD